MGFYIRNAFCFLMTAITHEVLSSGVLEFKFKSLMLNIGLNKCCVGEANSSDVLCPSSCRTVIRICLKQYQAVIETKSPCTFGHVIIPVTGEGPNHEISNHPLIFNFSFTWPRVFSLIFEVWHENENGTGVLEEDSRHSLIARHQSHNWVDPGEKWVPVERSEVNFTIRYEYRVVCDFFYYGPGCSNFCRSRNDRFGHYRCSAEGARVCYAEWTGPYCDQPKCLPGCSELHGYCQVPNECKCRSGWRGRFCDECERHPGCLHGTCQQPWECVCEEGWGGLFCNQDLNYCKNHKPCQNDGICLNSGEGWYTCKCLPGFTGNNCEYMLDSCFSGNNSCENGGTCRNSGKGFRCDCPEKFHGNRCEKRTLNCENIVCLNGGTCTDTIQGFQCRCRSAFSGPKCEIQTAGCGNGTCLNGGTCMTLSSGNKCQCVAGYTGSMCEDRVDYCRAKPCANGATCNTLPNNFECVCRPGFGGKYCSKVLNDCKWLPCRNGGTCIKRVNSIECKCPDGYRGPFCESYFSESESSAINLNVGRSANHAAVTTTLFTAVSIFILFISVIVMRMKHRQKQIMIEEILL